jgi:hypothetical protein
MPRRTAGKLDKPGQFTTEVWKTKAKAHLHGFIKGFHRGISFVNWSVFVIGGVVGAALMALFKQSV